MVEYKGADINFDVQGKTVIITGGAAGIGLATVEFFAKKDANVIVADLNPDSDKIAKSVNPKFIGVAGDICAADYRKSVIDKGVEAFGGIDFLVNCAGVAFLDKAEALSEEAWDKTIDINLKASFMMAQVFGNYLIENKRPGAIVNIASQAGIVAFDKHVAYTVSKGGVIALTKALAFEWGKYGIRVNAVSPTVVLTELGKRAWDNPTGDAHKNEIPAGRFAEPDEIAATIAFLCSNASAMINGHNLVVDGGYTIR